MILALRLPDPGQFCMLHGIHQDDPLHDYTYPDCELHMREATSIEGLYCWIRRLRRS